MTEQDRADILAEIVALSAPPMRQPGQIDAYEYAEQTGFRVAHSTRLLDAQVEAGVLETALVYDRAKGQRVRVWWKAR